MSHESVETLDLVVFLAVARTGSFGAAADELHLATPSVSARMSALERKLTAELFARTTRGSSLTRAGERLVPYARRCIVMLQEAHQAVRTEARDRVVIGAPASLADVVFPPILRILSDASLTVHCRVAHSTEAIGFLLDGTVDVSLFLNTIVPASAVAHRLSRSEILTVCSPRHPLAAHAEVSIDDLVDTRIAVYRWSPEAEALAGMFEHSQRKRESPVQLVGLPTAVMNLVAEHDYVGIVPEFAVAQALRAGTAAELALPLPGWGLDVQLAYQRDAATRPAVTTLVAALPRIVSLIERQR